MHTNFENTAELMNFYYDNEVEIISKYEKKINFQKPKGAFLKKSYAYMVISDFITEKELNITDCQINMLAEVVINLED